MRQQREEDYLSGNLTAMIDVVFQLIIFFVVTTNLQAKSIDERIHLALAPNGQPLKVKNPLEINIDVDSKGRISIARNAVSLSLLNTILRKAALEYGQDNVPVVIRGDAEAKHTAIRNVLNACGQAGIYKIKFAALKERGGR